MFFKSIVGGLSSLTHIDFWFVVMANFIFQLVLLFLKSSIFSPYRLKTSLIILNLTDRNQFSKKLFNFIYLKTSIIEKLIVNLFTICLITPFIFTSIIRIYDGKLTTIRGNTLSSIDLSLGFFANSLDVIVYLIIPAFIVTFSLSLLKNVPIIGIMISNYPSGVIFFLGFTVFHLNYTPMINSAGFDLNQILPSWIETIMYLVITCITNYLLTIICFFLLSLRSFFKGKHLQSEPSFLDIMTGQFLGILCGYLSISMFLYRVFSQIPSDDIMRVIKHQHIFLLR